MGVCANKERKKSTEKSQLRDFAKAGKKEVNRPYQHQQQQQYQHQHQQHQQQQQQQQQHQHQQHQQKQKQKQHQHQQRQQLQQHHQQEQQKRTIPTTPNNHQPRAGESSNSFSNLLMPSESERRIINNGLLSAGFDFGTVYSTIGLWKERKVVLMDIQGDTRIFSIVEVREDKGVYAKDAMQLFAPRGHNVIFTPKRQLYRGENLPEDYLVKYVGFIKHLAIRQDDTINSVVACAPGCFVGRTMAKMRNILHQQFQQVLFISDIAAIFLSYLYETKLVIRGSTSNKTQRYGVISFGGGFLSCGIVAHSRLTFKVEYIKSIELGGEQLVDVMKELILKQVHCTGNTPKAPGRFWNQCMNNMELLHDAGSVEFYDLSVLFNCSDEIVEVAWSDFHCQKVEDLLSKAKDLVMETLHGHKIPILISGGMCRFPPFRNWLDTYFPSRVCEMFNMNTSCAVGATLYAGIRNGDIPLQIILKDYDGFDVRDNSA